MNKWKEVLAPRLGVNDEYVTLTQWLVSNGEKMEINQPVAALESTKASTEFESPFQGYIYIIEEEFTEVQCGKAIAIITEEPQENILEEYKNSKLSGPEETRNNVNIPEDLKLTKKARELIEKHEIDVSSLPRDRILKENDIEEFIKGNHEHEQKDNEVQADSKINTAGFFIKNENANKILIYGGGGHAKTCIDILRQMRMFEIHGIIDTKHEIGSMVLGVPVIGNDEDLEHLYRDGYHMIVNGVGAVDNHSIREKIFNRLKNIGFYIPNIIHPKAAVEPSVKLGEGNQIMAGAVVGSDASIGNNCIINSGSIVSHDCKLGDNVHVAPGAILAGNVSIGNNTLIGMGSSTYLKVKIGSNVVVYNGCVINHDINDNSIITPQAHQTN
jgi:sugar O-acyltransferase (sialic acid O-acetyltransferase NeuD family)